MAPTLAAWKPGRGRNGEMWALNGTKRWITNGSIADIAIVWAKDDDGNIQGFIVETDRPGFAAPEIKKKLSLRASVTSDLILDDVEIPEDNRLPATSGLKSALGCLDHARLRHCVGCHRCRNELLRLGG